MDIVPVSLAIAQAAKETGWGTSRFALEGNALFGQWTWSKDGMKPTSASVDTKHKVMKFNVLQASVRAYQRNLNTHSTYQNFRLARAHLRDKGKSLDSIILSQFLKNYAETVFGGDFETTADYKDSFVTDLIKEKGWIIWPLIPFNHQTVNYNLDVPAPSPPSFENILGTDDQARDVLARFCLLYTSDAADE